MSKILIIRLTSLGDVIFTIPLACTLKENDENVKIGWVVAEKGLGVVQNNPCVDKCHFIPIAEWRTRPFALQTIKEFFALIKEIRAEKYDIALDCQQMFKSLFLLLFSGAKRRITFTDARELSVLGGNEFVKPKAKFRDSNYHIVERNLDFARHLGVEPQNVNFALPETSVTSKDKISELIRYLDHSKPFVVISPATTWKNKHWSERNWAELIDSIADKCSLIFTGTVADERLVERILNKTENKLNFVNLVGKTNVEDLRELFSRVKIVISPDSGSAHLAWASVKPAVVTIFTCTPAKRFGPYGIGPYGVEPHFKEQQYFSVAAELPCHPCFKKECGLKKGRNICQDYPQTTEIINIVNNLLK